MTPSVHPENDATSLIQPCEVALLERFLLENSRLCQRAPQDRFRYPWLSPMPPAASPRSPRGEGGGEPTPASSGDDGFTHGDYSLGLFHHDASEAAIELGSRGGDFLEACAGSLLCLLDGQHPSGRVHRAELPHKSREAEPSKPVLCQFGLRTVEQLGAGGLEWAERHRVYPKLLGFVRYLEREYTGLHGLMLTHSALQTGFDNDLLSAELADRTVEGPDTNAFMVLEYESLARLATLLGHPEAPELLECAARLRDRLERLCFHEDERGAFYTALRWQHGTGRLSDEWVAWKDPQGRSRPLETWASLLPLYAGIPSPERAEQLIHRLLAPEGYWGPQGIRTVPRWSPFFNQAARVYLFDHKKQGRGPVSNWCGPVWVLANYYLAEGLARYGRHDAARQLALKTARLLWRDLSSEGRLHENYEDSGRGLWPQSGLFISWNVLALTLLRRYAPELLSGTPE